MRYNPIYDVWVSTAECRARRQNDFQCAQERESSTRCCPFCEGNEGKTPSELDVMIHEKTLDNYRRPNAPGWKVRAVPNRFPFMKADDVPTPQMFGPYVSRKDVGRQEVLIDVPHHVRSVQELNEEEFQYLVHFYHRRMHQARKENRWRYAQLFKNQGVEAGASIEHIHSQLVAMSFVPASIRMEQIFLADYREQTQRCWHCDALEYERGERCRVVCESEYFFAFCPFASRFMGEVHISPKRHASCFVQSTREELDDLAQTVRNVLCRLPHVVSPSAFNLVLRTSPWSYNAEGARADENFHWRFEILPRTAKWAGYEMGTGCCVNSLAPESAAMKYATAGRLAGQIVEK
ncbi:MAG: DUF4921 family protein [Planctomycetia bacterium]|nr:DUF4921 family protein [Planctomycetia bacterium]